MPSKRQFKGTSTKRKFYDRKVQDTGYTCVLSMGKIIPKGWTYVRMTKLHETDTSITIRIDKLLGAEKLACYPQTCKTGGRNT